MERQRATHNCLCLTFHNSSFFPGRENTSFLAILEFIIIPLRNIFSITLQTLSLNTIITHYVMKLSHLCIVHPLCIALCY